MMDLVLKMEILLTGIVHTKFHLSTCLNSKDYNVIVCDDMVEQWWLLGQKILLDF